MGDAAAAPVAAAQAGLQALAASDLPPAALAAAFALLEQELAEARARVEAQQRAAPAAPPPAARGRGAPASGGRIRWLGPPLPPQAGAPPDAAGAVGRDGRERSRSAGRGAL